jgi:hypothetical protein
MMVLHEQVLFDTGTKATLITMQEAEKENAERKQASSSSVEENRRKSTR